jgi:hypothetical protein
MQNPLPELQSLIFGAGTDTPTYEQLKKKREIADLLAQQAMGGEYRNWGDGVGGLMKALGARMMDNKISGQEAAEGRRAASEVAKILAGMGPEGISVDQFTGLAGATENPYLPPEQEAIARAMMRRKVTEPTGTPFVPGGGIGNPTGMSSMDMPPQGPQDGTPFGWTDPGEIPPEGGGIREDAQRGLAEALQRFQASPTDDNAAAIDAARRALEEYGGQTGPMQAEPWIDGNLRRSGSGATLAARGPAAGPQVAQADTGTATDAGGTQMKLTEQQSKNLNFWNRMDATSADIDKYAPAMMDRVEQGKNAVPIFGNSLVSEDYQRGRRAGEEWLISILRPDTGAAVTSEEWDRYAPTFLPEPGDGPNMLEDKTAARKRAAAGLKKGLGLAEVLADELAAARRNPETAPAASDDWRTKDPSTWTDEQLREFTQ